MKYCEVERTFICQLAKAPNKAMLQAYVDRNDTSPEEFVSYYFDITNALKDTPAWGVSGVNDMVNKLTDSVRATLTHAKKGKTSAPVHAKSMIRYIEYFGDKESYARGGQRCKLMPLITEEELQHLLSEVV